MRRTQTYDPRGSAIVEHTGVAGGTHEEYIRQMTLLEPSEADPRWQEFFPESASLAEHVSQWHVGDAVPEGVADVLRVVRRLVVDSYYVYEYSHVAVTWGIVAVEASLRGCLPLEDQQRKDRRTFGSLVGQAKQSGFITEAEATVLQGTVELRNMIAHRAYLQPKPPPESYTADTVLRMIEAIHDCISDLYARALRGADA